jgi:hypothetical protein
VLYVLLGLPLGAIGFAFVVLSTLAGVVLVITFLGLLGPRPGG